MKLSLGGQLYDPPDPRDKMCYSMLAIFTEFESDLLRMRPARAWRLSKPRETHRLRTETV